jgi:hypothetical protein
MSTQIQLRRGTTVQHNTFTGALAEVTVDTDKKTLVVHDGTTPGGFPVVNADSIQAVEFGGTGADNASDARTNLGLGNVDNTSDANKPVSSATQTALNGKLNLSGGVMTGPIQDATFAPSAASTKRASINTDAVTAGQTRQIIVPDRNVDLGKVGIFDGVAKTGTGAETVFDWTSIPSGVRRITIPFVAFSTNGTSNPIVQLGDSGGFETTGYVGSSSNITLSGVSTGNVSSGFRLQNSVVAATTFQGVLTLIRVTGNTWAVASVVGSSDTTATGVVGAYKTLSAELDRIRVTTEGGANTIDSGSIVNVLWEF